MKSVFDTKVVLTPHLGRCCVSTVSRRATTLCECGCLLRLIFDGKQDVFWACSSTEKMHNLTPEKAKRGDWKIEPMPSESELLWVEAAFTSDEWSNITNGLIPEDMDDKWFIFYEAPFLYLHRSWTGLFVFRVRFEPLAGGMHIAEVVVNRAWTESAATNESRSTDLLKSLLARLTLPDVPRQERKQASQKRRAEAIVDVAEKMLSGETGIIEGARQLAALGSNKLRDEEQFLIFRAINSEADVLPTGQSRQHWNPDALQRKDQEIADYEASVKAAALQACQELVNTYSSGG